MVIKTKLVNVTSVPRSTLGGTQRVHSASLAKPVMLACGTCDAAGESAFSVGLPCKSGVADGIMAAAPDHSGICAWSPPLDDAGNSLAGRVALHDLTHRLELSVF